MQGKNKKKTQVRLFCSVGRCHRRSFTRADNPPFEAEMGRTRRARISPFPTEVILTSARMRNL
jgi:hypothetical protein